MAPGDTRQLKQEVEERGFGLEEGTLEGLGRGTEETVEGSAGRGGWRGGSGSWHRGTHQQEWVVRLVSSAVAKVSKWISGLPGGPLSGL